MDGTFFGCKSLTDIRALENWDTSNVVLMKSIFEKANQLENFEALKGWNV